jgi:hypothetical protein
MQDFFWEIGTNGGIEQAEIQRPCEKGTSFRGRSKRVRNLRWNGFGSSSQRNLLSGVACVATFLEREGAVCS